MHRIARTMSLVTWLLTSLALTAAPAPAAVAPDSGAKSATAPASGEAPSGSADARVDLTTHEGTAQVRGDWRYSDTKIVEVDFHSPGRDLKPSGAPNRTYDFTPHAGGADFDDSQWTIIDPTTLFQRRSTGRLCFNWYRINITIPERIGAFDPSGTTAVFEIVVDDYAEVWVDGQLPRELGQSGGDLVRGWNAPNRVVIGRGVRPGQHIQLAVFGANGPLSDPPPNFIWVRSAKLEFYREPRAVAPHSVETTIERSDAALDGIVPAGARLEKIAEGFQFTEGPVWDRNGGRLLFSDPNANRIYQWSERDGLSTFRDHSGYEGSDIAEYGQPGSNGLTLDRQGRLTANEHGRHRVTRTESDGRLTVLADSYEGKRLNSPNDLVYKSDGALYFTDPPFGLPKFFDDPRKELPYSGIYRVANGTIKLVSTDLTGPNGLAFSPDERFFYVDDWDVKRKVILRYEVQRDGSLSKGTVFFDMTDQPGDQALDGMKVDTKGNLYVSGPGGLWIISPAGRHLGTIKGPELPANFAWGDADGRTLYLTARTGVYRIRLNVPGIRP